MEKEIIKRVMDKKEFRELPLEDVKKVYSFFERDNSLLEEEKIKETRKVLLRAYTSFLSSKSFNFRDRDALWFLKKHKSTRERIPYYKEIYSKIFSNEYIHNLKKVIVYDFGCGLNGFSYEELLKQKIDAKYIGTEPVGQLCSLQNKWFDKNNFDGHVYNLSLFNLKENLDLIKKNKGKKLAFFFKVFDSLEILERNYSKEVLDSIVSLVDLVIVSWATKSLGGKKKIYANKKWLVDFISKKFKIVDDFSFGSEKYLIFTKK